MGCVTQHVDVVGMTCDHCARSVASEIGKIDGVGSVDVDLVSGLVTITSASEIGLADIASAVDEAGYALAG